MAESRDYRIITALMDRLRTIKKENGYEIDVNKVFIPKKNIVFDTYPSIAVFWNENHLDDEGFYKENSSLDVVLVYVDGLDDDNTEESYYVRLRNAGPSIRKCIMADVGLHGMCTQIKIETSETGLFQASANEFWEAHIVSLNISRTENIEDPYL